MSSKLNRHFSAISNVRSNRRLRFSAESFDGQAFLVGAEKVHGAGELLLFRRKRDFLVMAMKKNEPSALTINFSGLAQTTGRLQARAHSITLSKLEKIATEIDIAISIFGQHP